MEELYSNLAWSSLNSGKTDILGDYFAFTYNKGESARFFFNLFEKNNYLTVRHNDESFRFKTEGFWQTIEEQGLTREEIENAIANEEF